jgi:hypothetical protein
LGGEGGGCGESRGRCRAAARVARSGPLVVPRDARRAGPLLAAAATAVARRPGVGAELGGAWRGRDTAREAGRLLGRRGRSLVGGQRTDWSLIAGRDGGRRGGIMIKGAPVDFNAGIRLRLRLAEPGRNVSLRKGPPGEAWGRIGVLGDD